MYENKPLDAARAAIEDIDREIGTLMLERISASRRASWLRDGGVERDHEQETVVTKRYLKALHNYVPDGDIIALASMILFVSRSKH